MAPENFIKSKTSLEEHKAHLKDAVSSLASVTSEDVTIISSDEKQISTSRLLLTLFSPSLGGILASSPSCISPTILLPDCSSYAINQLLKILNSGDVNINPNDVENVLKTAVVLGVEGFDHNSLTASKRPLPEDSNSKRKTFNETVTSTPLYSCSECENTFKNKLVLRRHVLLHHKTKSNLLHCELCNFKTVDSYIFSLHLKRHDTETEEECDNLSDINVPTNNEQDALKHQRNVLNLEPNKALKFDSGLLEDKTVVAFKCKASGCSQAFPVRFKQSRQSPEFILKRLKLHWKLKHGAIATDGFAFDTVYEDIPEKDDNVLDNAILEELPMTAGPTVEHVNNTNEESVYNDSNIMEASNILFENTVNRVNENAVELSKQEINVMSSPLNCQNDNNGDNDRIKQIKLEPNISNQEEEENIGSPNTLKAIVYENNETNENERRESQEGTRKHVKLEQLVNSLKSSKSVVSIKQEIISPEKSNGRELALPLINSSSTDGDSSSSIQGELTNSLVSISPIEEESSIQIEQEDIDVELSRLAYEGEKISEEVQNVLKDLEYTSYTPSPVKLLPNVLEVIEPSDDGKGTAFVNIEDEDMQKKIEEYLKDSPISSGNLNKSSSYEGSHHICQVCSKFINQQETIRHYCYVHFMDELASSYGDLVNGKTCKDCKKNFATKKAAFLHIGRNHGKLNELLCKKGYAPITKNQLKNKSISKTPVKSIKQEIDSSQLRSESKKILNSHHSKVKRNLGRQLIHKKVLKIDKRIQPDKKSSLVEAKSKKHVCQICSKVMQRDDSFTWMHYGSHFLKELTEHYSDIVDDLKCTLCDKNYGSKSNVYLHIGRSHEKTNEILLKKGLVPLMPLNSKKKKISKPKNPIVSGEVGLGQLKRLKSFRKIFKSDKNSYNLDGKSEMHQDKNQIEPIDNSKNSKTNEGTGFHCQAPHCKIILKNKDDLPRHHRVHLDIPDAKMAVKNLETGEIIYPMSKNKCETENPNSKDKSETKPISTFSDLKKSYLQRKIKNLKMKLKNRTGNYQPGKEDGIDTFSAGRISAVNSSISENLSDESPASVKEHHETIQTTEIGKRKEIEPDMTYPAMYYQSNGRVLPIFTKKVQVCVSSNEIFIHFQKQYSQSKNVNQNCDLECQFCSEMFSDHTFLWHHYFSDHLYTEMYIKFGSLVARNICVLCGKKFFENVESLKHLGNLHGKLNELLLTKRMQPIFISENVTRSASLGNLPKNKPFYKSIVNIQKDNENKQQSSKENTTSKPNSLKTNIRKVLSPAEQKELKRISEEQKRNFNCDTCLTTLSNRKEVLEHSLLCIDCKFSCAFCGNSLEHLENLEDHKKGCKDRINYLYSVHIPSRYSTF